MRTALVVGSGPSGAATAFALVKAGVHVTMLDVGVDLEAHLQDLSVRQEAVDPSAFLERIRRQRADALNPGSIPAKMPFGSDFAYRTTSETAVTVDSKSRLVTSLALGGLSRAWGANVSHIADRDMLGTWPIQATDLDKHFAALGQLLDIAGQPNDIIDQQYSSSLPGQSPSFPLGPQGSWMMGHVEAHTGELAARGLICGRAKLAIGRRYATNGTGCVSCGLCMHGCPYNAIFSSADVIRALQHESGFRYVPRSRVTSFSEDQSGVTVCYVDETANSGTTMRADRLFLACGVIGTTAIVARSLNLFDHAFSIKDSTKYLFPFLTASRIPGAISAPANTLSQLFVQRIASSVTSRTVHGQLYGYNDLMVEPLRTRFGAMALWLVPAAAVLLERILIGMVYLHSDDSGTLRLKVYQESEARGLGHVVGVPTKRSDAVLDDYLSALSEARHQLGGRPLRSFATQNPPGLSQHFGGTLPMNPVPAPCATDVLGRPWQCERTHCVDSSILPSIPATPTALLLMANAFRIVAAAQGL